MLDETGTPQSGFFIGQLRRWGKKKSPESELVPTEKSEEPKPAAVEEPKADLKPLPHSPSIQPKATAEPPKVAPVVAPATSAGKQTPSLFRKKEEAAEGQQAAAAPKKEEEFTEEALQQVWKQFGEARLKDGAGDAEKLVLGRPMNKGESHAVVIKLSSQLESTILEKLEQDLIQHLRKELHNDHIFLTRAIEEQKQGKQLYTSKDKFQYMSEQNPALKELKDRLGLDFEY